MADRAYILSEREVQLLQDFIDRQRRSLVNPQARYHSEEQIRFAPDVYVARAPSGGIPGLVDYAGTGSGEATPGSAECDIYRLYDWGPVPGLVKMNTLTKTVWNISPSAVDPLSWVLVIRDKFGRWFTTGIDFPSGGDTGTGTGTGTDDADCGVTVSWTSETVECESGVLNVYSTNHYLYTRAGCLVLEQSEPSLVRTEGYCQQTSVTDCSSCTVVLPCYEDIDVTDYLSGINGVEYVLACPGEDTVVIFKWMCMPDGRCGWFNTCTCEWTCSFNCDTGTGTGSGTSTSTTTDPDTGTGTDGTFFYWCVNIPLNVKSGNSTDCTACCDGTDGVEGAPAAWILSTSTPSDPSLSVWGTNDRLRHISGCTWLNRGVASSSPIRWTLGRQPDGVWTLFGVHSGTGAFVELQVTDFPCCNTGTLTYTYGPSTSIFPWPEGEGVSLTAVGDCYCDDGILEELPNEVQCVYSDARPDGVVGGPWLTIEECKATCYTLDDDYPGNVPGTSTSTGTEDLTGTGERNVLWWCVPSDDVCIYCVGGAPDVWTLETEFPGQSVPTSPTDLTYVHNYYPVGCLWASNPEDLGTRPRIWLGYIPPSAQHSTPDTWQLIVVDSFGDFAVYTLDGVSFNCCGSNTLNLTVWTFGTAPPSSVTITPSSSCTGTAPFTYVCVASQVRPANALNETGYATSQLCALSCGVDTGTGTEATGTGDTGTGTGTIATLCCPGNLLEERLTVRVTNKTGDCTCLPDEFQITWDGSTYWTVDLTECGDSSNTTRVSLSCNLGMWILDVQPGVGLNGCIISSGGTPSSEGCDPFQLVFDISLTNCCTGDATFTITE